MEFVDFINLAQILVASLLTVVLLMQAKGSGIGTALGAQNVNIATFALGRREGAGGGEALALVRVDGDAPDAALDALRAIDAITEVRRVRLPAPAGARQTGLSFR